MYQLKQLFSDGRCTCCRRQNFVAKLCVTVGWSNYRHCALLWPMWASSVQCRHWSRHMEKTSFIPHAWVTNTKRASAATLPRQSAQKTCELVMRSVVHDNPSEECLTVWQPKQIKSEGNLSQVGAIKLQTGSAASAFVGFISAMQTLEHMEKQALYPMPW